MTITGKTKVLGIFGDPVGHSLSPVMHNAAFKALNLDMVYVPFHVWPDNLRDAVEGIRAMSILGVSVTIPHKEDVSNYLDEVDPMARRIGAVNTIVNSHGTLKGYNTDAPGYLSSLREDAGFEPAGKKIVVAGAGGAARAIISALISEGAAAITLANRTRERAERLADEFMGVLPLGARGYGELEEDLSGADLLVNTTSLGMSGKGELEVPLDLMKKGAVVSDIVYSPLETGLLRKARQEGLKTHDGLGMLVHQGVIAFELWTGMKPPADVMRKAALEVLGHI